MNGTPRVALVLAGGAGTRLWPLSTDERPKQFVPLVEGRTLFQLTLERVRTAGIEHVIVLTANRYARQVTDEAGRLGLSPLLVLEPVRRDSAAAIAAGVAVAARSCGPDALLAVLPSDHLIRRQQAFARDLENALALAQTGSIATFGVQPSFPATGYGYLERGDALAGSARAYDVKRFHEKPDEETARGYLAGGQHFWNSGMFVFAAATFAEEAEALMPDIQHAAVAAAEKATRAGNEITLDEQSLAAAPRRSIDHAMMEESRRIAMVEATFDWSDVGSWPALYDALPKDPNGNALIGQASIEDCAGSLIVCEQGTARASGLRHAVLVGGREGVLIRPLAAPSPAR